ncbi:MAG TPA: hypothetical protein P5064_04170 [Clostridia bacterium]|nr:hypothetical protein [Clostridiaceae bacterium]HOF26022.1 hypothetical protein [Clostridia bacterium]HOM33535.1 hypothetical protein [Clostridia bacterium]HOR89199.1 hypothetical protein [Clostridia bacterium]HOT70103.1 hypothetical protein [Clostridia bacterium]
MSQPKNAENVIEEKDEDIIEEKDVETEQKADAVEEQDVKKKKKGLIERFLGPKEPDVNDDSDYQSVLRKNFYDFDQINKKRQITSLRMAVMALTLILIVILTLYIVHLSDSTILLDKLIDSSSKYVLDNVMYVDNPIKYTEVVSELNVMRTLMNHNGELGKRQYAISELYYIAIQLPDSFVKYKAEIYDAFKNINEGKQDVGYKLIEELLVKIVEER